MRLGPIQQATGLACGRRLVDVLPEWQPAHEAHERNLPVGVRERPALPLLRLDRDNEGESLDNRVPAWSRGARGRVSPLE